MRIASLFSGAGALDYGLEQAGHELVFQCDSDPGARQVLKAAFPGVVVAEDIATVVSLPENTELVVAGFPCIDVSKAGNRKGLDGQSTGLVRHVFRLLKKARDDSRPVPWVLLENVEALLDRHGEDPPVISYIVQQFMALGYGSWSYRVISTGSFGLPNRRKRLFIVASMHGDARDVLLAQGASGCQGGCENVFGPGKRCYSCHARKLAERGEGEDDEIAFGIDLGNAMSAPGEDVVPTFTTCNDRLLLLLPDGRRGMLRIEDGERLQGLPVDWTAPCYPLPVSGAASARPVRPGNTVEVDVKSSRRWDLLGNAVTVPVGRWLGERLAEPYAYKFHGVGVGDRRMDALVASSIAKLESARAGRNTTTTTTDTTTNIIGGNPVKNIWSFVCTDELQEALLFPYIVKENDVVVAAVQNGSGGDEDEAEIAAEAAAAEVADVLIEPAAPQNDDNDDDDNEEEQRPTTPEELFQAAVLDRLRRNNTSNHRKSTKGGGARAQLPWDKPSWARCAWWVKGIGAFAATGISDAPILMPFQPLGEFITTLGRPPTQEECTSYVNRLQERGWQISPGLMRRLGGAHGPATEVMNICRLPGLLSDADMIGDIVWMWDAASSMYWPCEVLDPLKPIAGRRLPPRAVDMLTAAQKRASLPCVDGSGHDPMEESAENRRVMVSFLPMPCTEHPSLWQWANPTELDPWDGPYLEERERAATDRAQDQTFKYRVRLHDALRDAKTSVALKYGGSFGTTVGDDVPAREVEKMRRTRAAAAAAGVDLKRRCGSCKTCTQPISGVRRYDCLTQRMKAAALSGHAGAQVAVCGVEAVGACVSIWWDGNQTFFDGTICWFDPVSTEHTVAYEDGEVGLHRLWQHDERIQILNAPEEWPVTAVEARSRLRAAHERLSASRHAKDARAAAAVAAGVAAEEAAAARAAGAGAASVDDDGIEAHRQRIVQAHKDMLNMVAVSVVSVVAGVRESGGVGGGVGGAIAGPSNAVVINAAAAAVAVVAKTTTTTTTARPITPPQKHRGIIWSAADVDMDGGDDDDEEYRPSKRGRGRGGKGRGRGRKGSYDGRGRGRGHGGLKKLQHRDDYVVFE